MNVYACFEFNGCGAPILRAIKTYALAMDWRDADLMNRYLVGFTLDADPEIIPPRDLFEYAASVTSRADPGGADDKTNGESVSEALVNATAPTAPPPLAGDRTRAAAESENHDNTNIRQSSTQKTNRAARIDR